MPDKGKVYFLFNELQRREASLYIDGRLREVNSEIEQVKADMRLVRSAHTALDQILGLLGRMKEIAVEARDNPDCDRDALGAELETLKRRIDLVAAAGLAHWSPEEAARIRKMVGDV